MSQPGMAQGAGPARRPVMKTTRYEQVSSWLMTLLGILAVAVLLLSAAWFATRMPRPGLPVPVELIEFPGGSEEGAIEETLRVDSPLEERADASPADFEAVEREFEESLETVLELADAAVMQTEVQFETGLRNAGAPGSASGTGRRPLGSGPGAGGFPREQRWFVRFAEFSGIDEYARQLDFFGIELGAVTNGKLVYVSNLAAARPKLTEKNSGADEKRLYFTWQGGGRKQADLQLFAKAQVNVGAGVIFHFYPKETEEQLAQLEYAFRKRKASEIRRTYFDVVSDKSSYRFEVVRQTYLK
jgi:hypothetical protein